MGHDKAHDAAERDGGIKDRTFLYFLFVFNLIKFSGAGIRYFPLQDDFIQYWGYRQRSIPYLFSDVGFFDTRPFAGLLDIFIWSNFWNFLEIALIIISVLHFSSAVILSRALEKAGLHCGNIFMTVYLLFPAGFEAVYWLSASTRIAAGLFFVSLAVYAAAREKFNAAAFFLADLFAFGFYEQTAAVCFVLCSWIGLHRKRRDIMVCNICAAGVIGAYYVIMSDVGALAGRAAVNIDMYKSAQELLKSFSAALKLFFIGKSIILPIFAVAAVMLLYKKTADAGGKKLFIGILVFAAALIPHIASGSGHIPFRCVYPAAAGIAMAIEYAAEKINVGRVFLSSFTMFALSANLYQASVFSDIGKFNAGVCADTVVADGKAYRTVRRVFSSDIPDWYAEYMPEDITKSDWAFTGALRAWHKNINIEAAR